MKKIISLILSVFMVLSCFCVFTVGALDANDIADTIYSEESVNASKTALGNLKIKNLPDNFTCNIRDLESWTDGNPDNDVDLLGMDLDFLYNGKGAYVWGFLDVFLTDANGEKILVDGNPVLKISADDVSLAVTNLNIYLQRMFYNKYGTLELYTVENAISITNFIGGMLNPGFSKLNPANFKDLFNNKVPTSNEFYNTISTLSGLDKIITYNWIGKGNNYIQPVINALCGSYVEFYPDYYTDAVKLGAKIIEGAVNKINTVGPIEYVIDLLDLYTRSYEISLRNPTLDLFALKKDLFQSEIPENEINSFNGLLKLVFCNCNPNNNYMDAAGNIVKTGCFSAVPQDVDHFCPVEFPVARYSKASDSTEKFLYLYYYANLCGRYRGNADLIYMWKVYVDSDSKLAADDKVKIKAIIDGLFLGDIDSMIENAIVPLYKGNISTATDSLGDRLRNTFMSFLKKIADYFDYLRKLFSGEIIYGQGNSPFN